MGKEKHRVHIRWSNGETSAYDAEHAHVEFLDATLHVHMTTRDGTIRVALVREGCVTIVAGSD